MSRRSAPRISRQPSKLHNIRYSGHARQFHPRRDRSLLWRHRLEGRWLRQVLPQSRGLADRGPEVIRQNRDTLYSAAVFDLDAGPVTITLPDAGKRFMSLQLIDEDEYTRPAIYDSARIVSPGSRLERAIACGHAHACGSGGSGDVEKARALQDAIKVEQPGGPGKFEVPDWDPDSQKRCAMRCWRWRRLSPIRGRSSAQRMRSTRCSA